MSDTRIDSGFRSQDRPWIENDNSGNTTSYSSWSQDEFKHPSWVGGYRDRSRPSVCSIAVGYSYLYFCIDGLTRRTASNHLAISTLIEKGTGSERPIWDGHDYYTSKTLSRAWFIARLRGEPKHRYSDRASFVRDLSHFAGRGNCW